MKITRCKYGHYYDKAYFRECPHCCRERGGKDEDIIIEETDSSADSMNRQGIVGQLQNNSDYEGQRRKEKDRENVKRWIGEAWDGLEESQNTFMLFAAMPLKVIKNQEFCMDFCLFPEKDWETAAKMLSFKSQDSIRDLKPVQIAFPARAVLRILYKEEEIFHKELELDSEKEKVFYTFPVTVTDTRDRRFHMIKAVFEVEEQNIEIPLYLMPNP